MPIHISLQIIETFVPFAFQFFAWFKEEDKVSITKKQRN